MGGSSTPTEAYLPGPSGGRRAAAVACAWAGEGAEGQERLRAGEERISGDLRVDGEQRRRAAGLQRGDERRAGGAEGNRWGEGFSARP